ncbi:MAG: signal peptidase II [Deltaproteobacteria bacterium]|nr:signal peptidase II [Deltaproteobacteria bacterium]
MKPPVMSPVAFWMTTLWMIFLDQLPKWVVRIHIPLYHTTPWVPNLLDLTHVENKGVSYSFLGDLADPVRRPLLVFFSVAAVGFMVWYWVRHQKEMGKAATWGLMLLLSGAIGNLMDRAWFGTVTDFFHFRFYQTSFFVNNIADIQISIGVMLFVWDSFARSSSTKTQQP